MKFFPVDRRARGDAFQKLIVDHGDVDVALVGRLARERQVSKVGSGGRNGQDGADGVDSLLGHLVMGDVSGRGDGRDGQEEVVGAVLDHVVHLELREMLGRQREHQ